MRESYQRSTLFVPSLESSAVATVVSATHDSTPMSGLLDELLSRLPTVMNRKFVDEVILLLKQEQ